MTAMEPDFEFDPTPAEAPKAPTSRDPDAKIPVINRDARLYSIAITIPLDPEAEDGGQRRDVTGRQEVSTREVETIKVHPGLNYIPLAKIQQAQIVRNGRSALEMYRGRVEISDPCSIPLFLADQLIATTHSRSALETWAAADPRPDIKAAIAKRLPSAKAA